ncbi:DUF2251 domain-containing protein [Sinimarinibacterium sp. NLF-5-8]|uniref:DUF2251 domain-containing protein n=1 Tax=Sinimarinibacterium sp. NLF-5-8 TaxID=2698684 RepID=UPI00137BBA84|nr:DUF2251 domain-containing protein [Sinimarinibacterium sp. NLF-5-8]QHS09357.1 DUF2251 domain-containing protein [Sinimarinibacterium sp. NLF-5-8]
MPALLVAEQLITPGQARVIDARSPFAPLATRFEDDGHTAYFYALDFEDEGGFAVADSMLIYNVRALQMPHQPAKLQIIWSTDGRMSGLFIDDYAHAIFDFNRKRGYCRSNFPHAGEVWSVDGHDWREPALKRLFADADTPTPAQSNLPARL